MRPVAADRKKLVLAVIDAMKPAMLERAVAAGRAPALELLIERGQHVDDCVAAFPSVTPVCAASIATGTGPDRARDPGDELVPPRRGALRRVRDELQGRRRRFGIRQSLTDTIYNMNLEHLSQRRRRRCSSARRRGRPHRRHDVPDVPRPPPPRGRRATPRSTRLAATVFRHAVVRARASSSTPTSSPRAARRCRSQLGLPGVRDQHSGCVAEYLVEHDLFDFLLLSLPDNDTHSHKNGPFAQVDSLAAADRQIARMMDAGRRRRTRSSRTTR